MKRMLISLIILCCTGNMTHAQISDLKNDNDVITSDSIPLFTSLSVHEFDSLLSEKNIQLIDVRTASEYAEGALSHAMNIDILAETFDSKADSLLNKQLPVAVYCKGGVRSRKAAAELVKKGFTVYNLDKGFQAWEAEEKDTYVPVK